LQGHKNRKKLKQIYQILILFNIFTEKARTIIFRIQKAKIGVKTRFGKRVKIEKPWAVSIGKFVQLEDDVWLKIVRNEAKLKIGDYSFIGRGTEIDVTHNVAIGKHVLIAPRVFITDHTHKIKAGSLIDSQGCESKPVVIKDDVWIGTCSMIKEGIKIGAGAVIGSGAVVTKSVPNNAIAAGNPARIIGYRNKH
jgi:acetyltransferase-like isoleucine patch superfamily enzyme